MEKDNGITNTAGLLGLIAKEHPRLLLDALRENGFWIYALHQSDIEDSIADSKDNSDLSPISQDDIDYVNLVDSNRGKVSDIVDYNGVMSEIVMQIRQKRINDQENENFINKQQ